MLNNYTCHAEVGAETLGKRLELLYKHIARVLFELCNIFAYFYIKSKPNPNNYLRTKYFRT